MLSMRSGTLRNPKIALVSVLTAVSGGNRSINEPTSTRRPLPLLLKSRSSSTQPQGADEGFSQHRSTVKNTPFRGDKIVTCQTWRLAHPVECAPQATPKPCSTPFLIHRGDQDVLPRPGVTPYPQTIRRNESETLSPATHPRQAQAACALRRNCRPEG